MKKIYQKWPTSGRAISNRNIAKDGFTNKGLPVKSYLPNDYGLSGHVWKITQDW